jgi:hypothetical protein
MPFPREYTPRRRWIMTLVMWGVLAGTLGLAAVISRSPASANVALGARHAVGEISVALPNDWAIRDQSIVFVRQRVSASEPQNPSSAGRVVAVTVESDPGRFPADLVEEELASRGVFEWRHYDDRFPIGSARGVMAGGMSLNATRRWRGGEASGFAVAIARLPSVARIVRIEMQSPQIGRSDVALMRRIAETVEVRANATTNPTGDEDQ